MAVANYLGGVLRGLGWALSRTRQAVGAALARIRRPEMRAAQAAEEELRTAAAALGRGCFAAGTLVETDVGLLVAETGVVDQAGSHFAYSTKTTSHSPASRP